MKNNFYKEFESIFRGSRNLIKERLKIYQDFIIPFINSGDEDINALDLGCGRGEWLELLNEMGIFSVGVDLNSEMLQDCIELKLNVHKQDAIEYLKNTPDESFQIISAFHLVEHIQFKDLPVILIESLRVLKQGGLLVLETPNCENISVSTNSFYLDPSHVRQLPPDLMYFMAQYYGFYRAKIIGLNHQQSKLSTKKNQIFISDILTGVSPDYALIAQKKAEENKLNKFNDIFNKIFGPLKLADQVSLYDQQEIIRDEENLALQMKVANIQRDIIEENLALQKKISSMEKDLIRIQDSFSKLENTLIYKILYKKSRFFSKG